MRILLLFILSSFTTISFAEQCLYPDSPELTEQMNTCNSTAGQSWSCSVNRCLTTQVALDIQANAQACSAIENEVSKKQCYNSLVQEAVQREEGVDVTKSSLPSEWLENNRKTTLTLTGIHIITSVVLSKLGKGGGEKCPSLAVYAIGGIVGIMGEVYFHHKFKNNAEKIADEYLEREFEDDYTAQGEAFEYMAKEQEILGKTATTKSKIYQIEEIVYYSVIALAVLETMGVIPCLDKHKNKNNENSNNEASEHQESVEQELESEGIDQEFQDQAGAELDFHQSPFPLAQIERTSTLKQNMPKLQSSTSNTDALFVFKEWQDYINGKHTSSMTLIDYEKIKNNEKINFLLEKENPFLKTALQLTLELKTLVLKPAFAQGYSMAPSLAAGNGEAGKSFGKIINHPILRAVMAGVSAGIVSKLKKVAKTQTAYAKENAVALRKTRAGFLRSVHGTCSTRLDGDDPDCFCFLADGSRNSERSSSEICQARWNQDDVAAVSLSAANYSFRSTDPVLGCLSRSNEFDPTCECRRVTDVNGNNNCLTASVSLGSQIGGIGTALSIPQTTATASNIISGNTTAQDLDNLSLTSRAATLNRKAGDLLDKYNADLAKEKKKTIPFSQVANRLLNKVSDQITPAQQNEVRERFGSLTNSLPSSHSKKLKNNPQFKKALSKAKEELKRISPVSYKLGNFGKKSSNDEINDILFGSGKSKNIKISDYAVKGEKKYKIKGDISNNSSASLWKILSSRYQKSALQKLFAE